jgi:bifunctional oligoribonuclease and PAP phosphatase NrnA
MSGELIVEGAVDRPREASVEAALDRAAEVLSGATEVALACHVNPDPDALGSMFGLAGYLATRGVRVICSWPNQPLTPPRWAEVLGADPAWIVEARRFPKAPPVMVALDTASIDRLAGLQPNAERAGELIVLDHHRTNPGFGTVTVLDPSASSTAELAYRLIVRMGGELPDQAAAALYAGILTDTGRFQYEATTPATLSVAAELRRHRFDHARMGQVLFEDEALGYLRVLAVALERLVHEERADLVWTYLTQADIGRAGVAMSETDDLIDVVRMARGADVACVLKQQRDGRFKVSLRSKGASDVGAVAARFGGGGHRLAAGYTGSAGAEETIQTLVAALAEVRGDGRVSG